MDFSLPNVILASFLCLFTTPLFLTLFAHGPSRITKDGKRFIVSIAATFVLWAVLITFALEPENSRQQYQAIDLLTAVLLLIGGGLTQFTLWSLIAWGFTVSVLRSLGDANCPLSQEEWIHHYTDGQGIQRFTTDRFTVLLRFGMADKGINGSYVLTGRGKFFARLNNALRFMFGLNH
jgi:hypothetical protein